MTELITNFLKHIGLQIWFEPITEETFLPGILIRNGGIVIDTGKLLYPGDLLHEAGHLAVMPPRIRRRMNGDLGGDPIHKGGEIAAIAWSYAACKHLGLDPAVVFHEDGYKGEATALIENFDNGRYIGVPLLSWQEMTAERPSDGVSYVYPEMKSWLCVVDRHAN
jgi:hypothetical protein